MSKHSAVNVGRKCGWRSHMDRAGKEGNGQRAQALGSRAVVSNLPNAVTLEYSFLYSETHNHKIIFCYFITNFGMSCNI
jgi:hypothetical protein